MTMTFDELLAADTEDDALEYVLTELADEDPPWPVTDYEDGAAGLTLLRVFARALAEAGLVVRDVAAGGLLEEAAKLENGAWLTLLADQHFATTRVAAVFARPKLRLSCSGSAGPYTITPGQLWARATASGKLYSNANTVNATLNTGGTVDLEFLAESPGAAYNLPHGAGVELATPLPGVTVATVETTPGSGSCMVTAGVDEESNASLLTRARSRWATIGLQKTADAYLFLASSVPGVSGITKVLVDDTNPRGPGTLDIYLAGTDGGITDAPTLAAVNTYLQDRKAATADLEVLGAINDAVPVVATIYHTGAAPSAELADALAVYEAALPIADGAGTGVGTVYLTQLIEVLMSGTGVRNVVVSSPAADYTPTRGHIANLTPTLTFAPAV